MTVLTDSREKHWQGAALALTIGFALSLASIAGLLVDQISLHNLADHVNAQYAPYGKVPDPDVLFGYLYTTAGLGAAVWLIAIRGVADESPGCLCWPALPSLWGRCLRYQTFSSPSTEHRSSRCCGAF